MSFIEHGVSGVGLLQETVQVVEPQLTHHSEVYDEHTEIAFFLRDRITPRFITHPDTVKHVTLSGEPGSSKGTYLGQAAYAQAEDEVTNEALSEQGKKLSLAYISTSMIVKEGIARGLQTSAYGAPRPEETQAMTRMADEALQVAEEELATPDVTVIFQELVAVDESFNLGVDILKRQARSEDAAVVFVASNPAIQEREYKRRKQAWEPDSTNHSKKSHAVFDMDPDDAKHTMGTHTSIALVTGLLNTAMHDSWIRGDFTLPISGPHKMPQEVLAEDTDPRELEGSALTSYFEQLTNFTKKGMKTNPHRPYLQASYFEHLAEKWDLKHALVVIPRLVTGSIHGYPQYLSDHALDLSGYVDKAEARKIRNSDLS